MLSERYGDGAFQAVFIEIQLNIAPQIGGQRPLEQQPPEPAACRRPHRRAARLGPAYPKVPVLAVDLPGDSTEPHLPDNAPCFAAFVANSCIAMPSVKAPLALNCTGGPETRTLLPSSRKYGANSSRSIAPKDTLTSLPRQTVVGLRKRSNPRVERAARLVDVGISGE